MGARMTISYIAKVNSTTTLTPTVSILEQLRQDTRESHMRIEKSQPLARIFDPQFSLLEYKMLLSRFYGFYAAIEPILFNRLPVVFEKSLIIRKKTHWLADDLIALGMSKEELDHLPVCFALPEMKSFAHKLGVFYVLEGSTLGGQVIRRHLLQQFGDSVVDALMFYSGYGSDTGKKWRAFRELVTDWQLKTATAPEEAIVGANNTFRCLQDWLEAEASKAV